MKGKTQSNESKKKAQFRRTAKWKKFRIYMKKECGGIDFITGKKLLKGFQLHHKDMRIDNYTKLEPERFLCCNKRTHEFIHYSFFYYEKDPAFLDRLKKVLDEMQTYNHD